VVRERSFILGVYAVVALLVTILAGGPAAAESRLGGYLDKLPLADIFPGADRLGPVEGTPPVAVAYRGDTRLGYVFLNADVVNSTGYSGRPINVVVGMDTDGKIVGARLVEHHEPIVLIGIPVAKVNAFIAGLVGTNPAEGLTKTEAKKGPDIISGATVTVLVIGDTVRKAAIVVARAHGIGPSAGKPAEAAARRAVDLARTGAQSWDELVADGSVKRLHLTVAEVNEAFARSGDPRAAERPEAGAPDEPYVDVSVALVSAPVVGRSLLGDAGYNALRERLGDDGQAILVMGQGRYSFRGSGYVRGGIFDRIQLVQGESAIRFRDRDYERLGEVAAAGAPSFPEIGLFVLPKGSDFDPARPWRLDLLVQRPVGALDKVFITLPLPYELPEKWLAPAPQAAAPVLASPTAAPEQAQATGATAGGEPLWMSIWRSRVVDLAVLAAALVALTLIFFFQDWLVRRPRLSSWIRTVFLLFTLFWIGWYANAQLSVVNVLTLASSLVSGFRWDYFLMDPLIFVLWSAVAAALLFWGRGAYCGWLCPFGALQEFANRIARRLKIPQLNIPWGVHERLWPIKYIVFLGLFGMSLYSLANAERLSEIEPFKTAIILKFIRAWPFVLYAGLLLGAGLFVERFFCRYLCPLGAALAIPARIRMFDWLKRYRECGSPCQRCANECPVQSIHPDGRINPNECISCLHCQELYWDDRRCPVVIQRRLKRERLDAMSPAPKSVPKQGS
jgi:NosR/NirI family transcriptional regulator, nitrous oxide reductase regulator